MQFNELNLIEPIQKAITDVGYVRPTEIQSKAIPYVLEGTDVLACAQTGTGKTAAFAIPILQLLDKATNKRAIRALILTPTRELALQIHENFEMYGKYLRLKSCVIFGGVPQGKQVAALKQGADILIATPGRLMDLIGQGYIDLSAIETFVLDEADKMLDMGFVADVKRVLLKLPVKRQTLFFSATMPREIMKLANSILHAPAVVSVTPVSSTNTAIKQGVYFVEKQQKAELLIQLLKNEFTNRSLVFTRTKAGADRLVKKLGKTGIKAAAIHGDKSQSARQRALYDFRDNHIQVLVATDIAARGIDIAELPYVINYEIPEVPETYVHRIGRTGRAGMTGTAVSFCDMEEMPDFNNIQKLIGFKMPILQ